MSNKIKKEGEVGGVKCNVDVRSKSGGTNFVWHC